MDAAKQMFEETVNRGLVLVRFFIPDSTSQTQIEMHLPCIPSEGDFVRVGAVNYKALAPQWVINEGAFVPYTLQVHVILAKLPSRSVG